MRAPKTCGTIDEYIADFPPDDAEDFEEGQEHDPEGGAEGREKDRPGRLTGNEGYSII